VLCESECACLHQPVNIVVFFTQDNENTYPKGRVLVQMYRVVPQTKTDNSVLWVFCIVSAVFGFKVDTLSVANSGDTVSLITAG